jgi:hypothetical protein
VLGDEKTVFDKRRPERRLSSEWKAAELPPEDVRIR